MCSRVSMAIASLVKPGAHDGFRPGYDHACSLPAAPFTRFNYAGLDSTARLCHPLTYSVDAMRDMLATGNLHSLPLDFAVIVATTILFLVLASLGLRKWFRNLRIHPDKNRRGDLKSSSFFSKPELNVFNRRIKFIF